MEWAAIAITGVLLVVLVGGLVSTRRRGRRAYPLPPLETGDATRVGRVWTNNDPLVVVDAEAADAWTGVDGDYDRIYEQPLEVGGRTAVVLMPEVDEGPVELFTLPGGDILVVSVSAADEVDWDTFLGAAGRSAAREIGRVDVPSGHLAVFHAAAARRELTVVEAPAEGGEPFADELLSLRVQPATYAVRESVVEEPGFSLYVWRLTRG